MLHTNMGAVSAVLPHGTQFSFSFSSSMRLFYSLPNVSLCPLVKLRPLSLSSTLWFFHLNRTESHFDNTLTYNREKGIPVIFDACLKKHEMAHITDALCRNMSLHMYLCAVCMHVCIYVGHVHMYIGFIFYALTWGRYRVVNTNYCMMLL